MYQPKTPHTTQLTLAVNHREEEIQKYKFKLDTNITGITNKTDAASLLLWFWQIK